MSPGNRVRLILILGLVLPLCGTVLALSRERVSYGIANWQIPQSNPPTPTLVIRASAKAQEYLVIAEYLSITLIVFGLLLLLLVAAKWIRLGEGKGARKSVMEKPPE